MWDYNLLSALQSVEKTMGYVLHRWLMFLAVAAGFLFATLAGAGTAIGIGSLSNNALTFGHFGAFAAFAAFSFLAYKLRRTLFLSVRLPHLFLLQRIRHDASLPEGRAQVEFARQAITGQFANRGTFWDVREAGRAVLSDWTRHRSSDAPSTGRWAPITAKILPLLSAANVDLVLARLFDNPGAKPWQTAREGLLLLAANSDRLLKSRLGLIVFEAIGWLLAYLLLLLAFQKIAAALPFPTGYWPHVFAFLFGWNIKASFLEPTVQAALLQIPLRPVAPEESVPLAETLAACSPAFREITERAAL